MDANPVKPYFKAMETKSLFSKLAEENEHINRDTNVDQMKKTSSNFAYKSFQRSLNRLQSLNKSTNYWSKRDQELAALNIGVGGASNTFRTAHNFIVNDPRFFKDRNVSHGSKYVFEPYMKNRMAKTVRNSMADPRTHYIYMNQSKDLEVADLYEKNQVFTANTAM